MVLVVRAQEARHQLAGLLIHDIVRNSEAHRVDVEIDHGFQLRGLEHHVLQAAGHALAGGLESGVSDAKYRLPALGITDQESPRFEQRRVDLFDDAAVAEQANPQCLQSRLTAQVERRREQAAGGRRETRAWRVAGR